MSTTIVFDCTHANIGRLPADAPGVAGYTTGSADIRWTAADWARYPHAVRIDQDAAASDPSADCLDVEQGAASPGDCPGWARQAAVSYAKATRPGQRKPAIYMSRSMVTPVVNALTAAGIRGGVALWIADWNKTQAQAAAEVEAASGPYPVIGVQFRNAGAYDISVFSTAWLKEVSVSVTPPVKPSVPVPPGQWKDTAWTWKEPVIVAGTGLDGKTHMFALVGGTWAKVL